MLKVSLIALFFVSFITNCFAAVYKSIDETGHVSYSDEALDSDASAVNLPPLQTFESSELQALETEQGIGEKKPEYSELSIIAPQNQQTFTNVVTIPIKVDVKPRLRLQHKLVVKVSINGRTRSLPESRNTLFKINANSRGEYIVQAQIVNNLNKVIMASPPRVFYVKKTSILLPNK